MVTDVLKELDEVSLPVLLQRIQPLSQTVVSSKTPERSDLKATAGNEIHQEKFDEFSPDLVSSVPRDLSRNTQEQAQTSSSINFADLAKTETVLAQGSLLPTPVQSSLSLPTFSISCNSSEIVDVSQPTNSEKFDSKHEHHILQDEASKPNHQLGNKALPRQGQLTPSFPRVLEDQKVHIVPSDSRSASLSRALAEPFTLMDGLPPPDLSINSSNCSTLSFDTQGDGVHSTSAPDQSIDKSGADVVQSVKQLEGLTKSGNYHESSRLKRLKVQNTTQRRHTYWEIIKEAEAAKGRF